MKTKVFCFFWSNGCSYHAQNLISSSIGRQKSNKENPESLRGLVIEILWILNCLLVCLFACLLVCLFACLLACSRKAFFAIFSTMPQPISILFSDYDVEFQAQTFCHRTQQTILLYFLTKSKKLVFQSDQIQYIHTWITVWI